MILLNTLMLSTLVLLLLLLIITQLYLGSLERLRSVIERGLLSAIVILSAVTFIVIYLEKV